MIDSVATYQSLQPPLRQPNAAGIDIEATRKAAQDFEAQVIGQFVELMFEGVGEDPMFGGGSGGEMFKSLLHTEYAKEIAASGGLGITDAVTAELLRAQENAQ